jgi:hypothetical protein
MEAPSNSEMISSLPAMSGCSKALLGLETLIWRWAVCVMD